MNDNHFKNQRGTTMLLSIVFMLGMLGFMGLAIDTGHLLVNKTRLQNALDAAALSAAATLKAPTNNSAADATNAGILTFNLFKAAAGNSELAGINLTAANFTYSDRVNLFSAGTGGTPTFVRVTTNALQVNHILIQAITQNPSDNVAAVSTAGPIGQNCDMVPLVICADVDPVTGEMDRDCGVDEDGIKECFGYKMGEESELHTKFCPPNDTTCQATALEAGNFTLLRFDGSAGKNDIRNSLAGTVNTCEVGVELETEPGNAVGPVGFGINDRFNADTVTTTYDQLSHPTADSPAFETYGAEQESNPNNPNGIKNNRLVAAPVGDCNGIQNGNTTFNFTTDDSGNMAVMCLLIRRPVRNTGPDNDPDYLKNSIYIEMTHLCPSTGQTDPTNPIDYGPYKIVLFKSEASQDS